MQSSQLTPLAKPDNSRNAWPMATPACAHHCSDLIPTERVTAQAETDTSKGRIVWARGKSLWYLGHTFLAVVVAPFFITWDAVLVFVLLSGITLCAGHSVGMHRLLIHRSFSAPLWLERLLVWLGTLVGMAGPFGMIRAHDMRDWHQRQTYCPPHPSHGAGFWRDAWWQMNCEYRLEVPPRFAIEEPTASDPFYRFVERSWMAQQLPLALILFALGGWAWVLWGVSVRVFVSLTGHWMVGHYAHRQGHQGWRIAGLPVQGYNLPGLGLLSFGENWHGNHHAFPHSARLGVEQGQTDPGFWFIKALETLGLAWDIKTPNSEAPREGLTRISEAR
ncbi:acyl-CoA desaturase [uncultured Litoreibacter sp.]|uniref:acyl-CoA desaturase n=1 Tax=uncultured Litoreibacter sp. TaxID=1392394 RepID=UPI002613E8A9|nr:acyl-CoA desaturase [uncultured Litoreibacter sp.]